jgi:hypothetical protein
MKITRRELVIAAAAGTVALKAQPQTQSPADRIKQNADTLAKFSIPITTEPAFQFKA